MSGAEASQFGLVGRTGELDDLALAYRSAVAGAPRVVIVEGIPGMGKTALLDAFAGCLDPAGVVRVACDPVEAELDFGVAGILVGEVLDGAADWVAVGQRLLARMGDLQDATAPDAAVLLLDDVQWMDQYSVQALRFALRRLRADRVLVVLARRPATGDDSWATVLMSPQLAALRRLGPWTATEVVRVAREQFGQEVAAADAELLVAGSGGLPLLVTAALADRTASAAFGSGPTTVAAGERLMRSLDPQSRRLVEALAVLAEPASLIRLGAVAAVTDPSLALAGALAARAVRHDVANQTFAFTHALYQSSVYDCMPVVTRRELHSRAAAWTTGDRSLRHRVAAADRPSPDLVRDLEEAADRHSRANRHAEAASLLSTASTVCGDAGIRHRLLLTALAHRLHAGDLPGAAALQAEAESSPPCALRSFALGLLMRMTARVAEATELLSEAMDLAAAEHRPDLESDAAVQLASLHAQLNDGPSAVVAADRALETGVAEHAAQARLMRSLGVWSSGDSESALRELADDVFPVGTTSVRADQLLTRGLLHWFVGDLRDSAHDLDAAAQLAGVHRPSELFDRLYMTRCSTRHALGDWDGASVDAAAARALAQAGNRPWTAAAAYAVSVNVPAGRGQLEVAQEYLDRALEAQQRMPSLQARATVAVAALRLGRAREDWAGMLDVVSPFRRAEAFDRLCALRTYHWVMINAVEALIRLGRLKDAAAELARYELLLVERPGGWGRHRLDFLCGLLAAAQGDARAARDRYARELAVPRLIEQPFLHASTLLTAGSLERAVGNRREAIDLLRRARDLARTLRATPLVEACDGELDAAGLHQASSDPLALTSREQDVAALVARGLTNGEVASELFLTVKTVEYHLRNIYAKLGITGRKQLRLAFAAASL